MFGFNPFASAPFADTGAASAISITVSLTGVQAVGYLGTASVTGTAVVNLTGV